MCFRPTGGVSGIHISGDYFGLGGGTGLKLCRRKGSLGLPVCVKTCFVQLSGCLHVRCKWKGTSGWVFVWMYGWVLFYWQYHSFINTWVPFLCRGNLRGVINKSVKYHKALKCVNCIFIMFLALTECIWFIHIFWPFSYDLIVYFCLFASVSFQILKICHYVQLYVIIYWDKHNFCILSHYTTVSSHCMLFCCI